MLRRISTRLYKGRQIMAGCLEMIAIKIIAMIRMIAMVIVMIRTTSAHKDA